MVRLQVISGRHVGAECLVENFPCVIGRDVLTELSFDAFGEWTLAQGEENSLLLTALAEGPVLVNGQPTDAAIIEPGSVIELGGIQINVELVTQPAPQAEPEIPQPEPTSDEAPSTPEPLLENAATAKVEVPQAPITEQPAPATSAPKPVHVAIEQYDFKLTEFMTWAGLGLIIIAQIGIILWLTQ